MLIAAFAAIGLDCNAAERRVCNQYDGAAAAAAARGIVAGTQAIVVQCSRTASINGARAADGIGHDEYQTAAIAAGSAGTVVFVTGAATATEEKTISGNTGIVGQRPAAKASAFAAVVATPRGIAGGNRGGVVGTTCEGVTATAPTG